LEEPIYPTAKDNEIIIDNPSSVDLINALKVSGRTKDGLGVGIQRSNKKRHLLQLKTRHTRNKKRRSGALVKL
jgi:hypothetical protein